MNLSKTPGTPRTPSPRPGGRPEKTGKDKSPKSIGTPSSRRSEKTPPPSSSFSAQLKRATPTKESHINRPSFAGRKADVLRDFASGTGGSATEEIQRAFLRINDTRQRLSQAQENLNQTISENNEISREATGQQPTAQALNKGPIFLKRKQSTVQKEPEPQIGEPMRGVEEAPDMPEQQHPEERMDEDFGPPELPALVAGRREDADQIDDLTRRLQAAVKERDEARDQLDAARCEGVRLGRDESQNEIGNLQTRLKTKVNEVNEKAQELQAALTAREKSLEATNNQLKESQEQINALKSKLQGADDRVLELTRKLEEASDMDDREALQGELEQAGRNLQNVQEAVDGLEIELNETLQELRQSKATLTQTQTEKTDLEDRLRRKELELKAKIPMAIGAGVKRGLEVGERRGRKEIERTTQKLQNAQEAAESLETELRDTTQELKQKKAEKKDLEEKLRQSQLEFGAKMSMLNNAEARVKELTQKLEDNRGNLTNQEALKAELTRTKDDVKNLEVDLESVKDEIDEIYNKLIQEKGKTAGFEKELKKKEMELKTKESELKAKGSFALRAGSRGLEVGEERGAKRGREEAHGEIERATKVRKTGATFTGGITGIGAGLAISPMIQQGIAQLFPHGGSLVHNAMAAAPWLTATFGAVGLGLAARKLFSYSVIDQTPR